MTQDSLPLASPYIALVGSPNSGKTSLFNALTGSRQKVGNYPGVTVERKEGKIRVAGGQVLRILDLPGTYSLQATTIDEGVTRDVLMGLHLEPHPPSLLIAVADATNLERNLSLVLELKALGIPTILALNMMDLAKKRGFHIDLEKLSQELGMPVFPVIARRKKSAQALLEEVARKMEEEGIDSVLPRPTNDEALHLTPKERLKARYALVDKILSRCRLKNPKPSLWTERIDRIVLHPVWGTVLLYVLLGILFQSIFNWATFPMEWMEQGVGTIASFFTGILPDIWLRSLLVDGIIAGVGSVIIFLPQILGLFFIILLLEDSGYMARAAFLMDRHMSRVGLHGRAFIPLLSSFACAIPGVMATRTIEHRRDRLITILISPLMACSARIPVYTLLIAAFIPNRAVLGPIRLQGLVMLGLYVGGAVFALIVAWILKRFVTRGEKPLFLLELPTYKWPNFRNVLYGMWERAKIFLKRAGTIILAASMVIWFLSSYPKPPPELAVQENSIQYSYAGRLGKWIEPAIRPIGFDWTIGVGLITGVVAREVIVGTLGTLYSVQSEGSAEGGRSLGQVLKSRWSLATGLSLLVFFVFAMQCLSTLAVVRRETNSWKWPMVQFLYLTGLAYGASWVTYHAVQWWLG